MKHIGLLTLIVLLSIGMHCQTNQVQNQAKKQLVVNAASPATQSAKTQIQADVPTKKQIKQIAPSSQPPTVQAAKPQNVRLTKAEIIMMRRQQQIQRMKKIQQRRQKAIQAQQASAPIAPNVDYSQQRAGPIPVPFRPVPVIPSPKAQAQSTSKPGTKSGVYCGSELTHRRSVTQPEGPPETDKRLRLVSTLYNFSMYVDAHDSMVSNSITGSGTWEPNYINIMGHIVKQGDNVMNLGSQSGLEALVMGKIIGPTGKLFIFEPYSFSNKMVTKNVEINGMKDYTTVYKIGASDQKTTATIQVSYYNTGGSEIIPTSATKSIYNRYSQQQIVEIDKVDSVLPKDVKLDFALLDVQKMQTKALRGMKQVIARSPNLIIMAEWQYAANPRRSRQDTMDIINFMKEHGYRFYSYAGGNYYNCSIGRFFEYTRPEDLLNINFLDIFFIPNGHPLLSG